MHVDNATDSKSAVLHNGVIAEAETRVMQTDIRSSNCVHTILGHGVLDLIFYAAKRMTLTGLRSGGDAYTAMGRSNAGHQLIAIDVNGSAAEPAPADGQSH